MSHDVLPPRYEQVTHLAACGKSNKEIAHEIGIREGTVAGYLTHLYELLDLQKWGSSRVRLVLWRQQRDRECAGAVKG